MGRHILITAISLAGVIFVQGCSKSPDVTATKTTETKKEPDKPPEAITASAAFYEMNKQARAWASDILTLNIKSGEVPNIKNEEGKAGVWTAVFVSPSRREARTFTYAVAPAGDLRKGINISEKQIWGGATPTSKAFTNSEFSVDSDAAYKAARVKAAGWLKTHPNVKVTYTLGSTSRFPAPVWYIMWGTSKNGYAAYVNATTGELVTN